MWPDHPSLIPYAVEWLPPMRYKPKGKATATFGAKTLQDPPIHRYAQSNITEAPSNKPHRRAPRPEGSD